MRNTAASSTPREAPCRPAPNLALAPERAYHSRAMDSADEIWPDLTYAAWRETLATLHLWTQIVGKIRLTLTPWLNHSWQTPLYVTARGLGASPIPFGAEIFEIEFDFVAHRLNARPRRAAEGSLPLRPQSVADFYRAIIDLLD